MFIVIMGTDGKNKDGTSGGFSFLRQARNGQSSVSLQTIFAIHKMFHSIFLLSLMVVPIAFITRIGSVSRYLQGKYIVPICRLVAKLPNRKLQTTAKRLQKVRLNTLTIHDMHEQPLRGNGQPSHYEEEVEVEVGQQKRQDQEKEEQKQQKNGNDDNIDDQSIDEIIEINVLQRSNNNERLRSISLQFSLPITASQQRATVSAYLGKEESSQ